MRIIGYVIRGVRLLVAPWRASSQSIWHLNGYHKGSVALFQCFWNFFGCFLALLVPLVRPVSSWRMGWSPPLSTTSSRKDRPRWPRPKGSQFSWTSWCISVQVKTRRYSQGKYWYQTEETLDIAQHCWCGSTNVGRFLFTRASCWLMEQGAWFEFGRRL